MAKKQAQPNKGEIERAPVVAVMGHIDHGKSSLLDYIRKSNIVDKEAGGITQHIASYEVVHTAEDGSEKKITFIDTPGHEAFGAMRKRGASISDIVILIVSAEDGPKPQTLEAYQAIKEHNVPFVVAINKIDRPNANPEKVKADLLEHEIYVEGMGGDIPFNLISAKTGDGIPELLSTILLMAELEELKADTSQSATGAVIEAHLDAKKGISATLIIKDGSLKQGQFIVSGASMAPVRIMEDFQGKPIKEASATSPIRITGWSELPETGMDFEVFENRKDAEAAVATYKELNEKKQTTIDTDDTAVLPIILKTDVAGSYDAVMHEIEKIPQERLRIKVVASGTGAISEGDIKQASGKEGTLVVGFGVKIDAIAKRMAEQLGITIETFPIIYELAQFLEETARNRTPQETIEEVTGRAKILKCFSTTKDKQVIGGKIEEGVLRVGQQVNITRRTNVIGTGKLLNLQQQKAEVQEVKDEGEFGMMIESKIEIAPSDRIEAIELVTR